MLKRRTVLTTGVNGTPMVSYAETLSADERWQVASYLERIARNTVRFNTNVLASVGNAELPTDPGASFWDTVAADWPMPRSAVAPRSASFADRPPQPLPGMAVRAATAHSRRP